MTHDAAPSHEFYNHLGDELWPLQPVALFGVTAGTAEDPHMETHYAMWHWWAWKGLPYMAAKEHAEDTAFIVCEGDFCFTQEAANKMLCTVDKPPGTPSETHLHAMYRMMEKASMSNAGD